MLVLSFLSGCTTVGPDYDRPAANVQEQWLDVDDPRVNIKPSEHPEWWKVFADPVLDGLIETARHQNLTLRSAGVRVLEARAQLGIATGGKYPQLQQLSGEAARVNLSENATDNVPLLEDSFSIYRLEFNLTWELDFWGRFRRLIESAAAQLDATVANYDAVMVALTAEVARTYVLIRTLEERIALAQQNVVIQQRALRIADVKFRHGAVTGLDVQQAKTVLGNTQALIPQLEVELRRVRNALAVLLGMSPAELAQVLTGHAPIPIPPPEVAIGMPQDLVRRRPDVRRAERVMAAQSAQIGVAVSDLYPHFTLGGVIGFGTTDIGDKSSSDLFDSDSGSSAIFGAFRWDVFNYGRLKNNIRVQDARFQQLVLEYRNAVLKAQAEVENAIVAYLRSHAQARFLEESARAAQRSVELAFVQYREGVTDFDRVLSTMSALSQQQDILTTTNGAIAANLVELYKALGGGWLPSAERQPEDFVTETDKEQLRTRTKYWKKVLPASDDKKPAGGK